MHKTQLSVRLGSLLTRTAVVALAIAVVAVGCGGGGGGGESFDGTATPGFFIGTTHQGEPMTIEVDSIRAVFVSCGGPGFEYVQVYDPAEPISVDGEFAVNIASGLRFIAITGVFSSDDHITGTIEGDPFCDGDFDVRRCNSDDPKCQDKDQNHIPDGVQPTPTATPTQTPIPTLTPTPTPTTTPSGATPSGSTPSSVTPTPATSATPADVCGDGQVTGDEDCDPQDPDLADETCDDHCTSDLDPNTGTVRCTTSCKFDFSGCADHSDCS